MSPTLAAIAAAAVVLALVAGLLIGRGERVPATNASSPAPITVSVPGADGTTAAAASDGSAASSGKSFKKSKRKKTAKAPRASLDAKGQQVGTADKATLDALQNTSGKDYSKKSANLPTTTVLPGKLPPKDNKKAGGGSKEVEIG